MMKNRDRRTSNNGPSGPNYAAVQTNNSTSTQQQTSSSPLSRILSGSIGSIIYVLTLTPLEVVKVRLQAGTPPNTTTITNTGSGSILPEFSSRNTTSGANANVKAFLRGRGAVRLHNGLVVPKHAFPCLVAPQYRVAGDGVRFDFVGTRRLFESTTLPSHPRGLGGGVVGVRAGVGVGGRGGMVDIFRTLRSIARHEGRAGLYAGLRPTLLAAVPNTAIYFTAYDEITTRLHLLRRSRTHGGAASDDGGDVGGTEPPQSLYVPLVAGASARLLASFATAPLELVRTRQAGGANTTNGSSNHTNGVLEEFHTLLRSKHGVRSLYRGLGPTLLRDVPFSALYFFFLETFRNGPLFESSRWWGTWGTEHHRERGTAIPPSAEVMRSFASGAAAGAIATIVTTPFDLVKTRRQLDAMAATEEGGVRGAGGDGQRQRRQASSNRALGCGRGTTTTFGYMRQIVREEGFFAGLWRGNQIRMIKVAPGCAIMISCYEFGKRFLDEKIM
mmetsp:Transcript_16055/g.27347  ORF Transcript_16055/g.27347 Transcript_16055/m.27347 type:complete len:501 (-) Transcript_16055:135-1637(-)